MRLIYLCIVFLFSNVAANISLMDSATSVNDENLTQIASTSYEYARARKNHLNSNDGIVKAFYRIPNTDQLFSLSEDMVIHLTDFTTRQSLSRWPLTRWSHEYIPIELTQRLQLPYTYQFKPNIWLLNPTPGSSYRGCLYFTPLRYGDIDNNNSDELVIFGMDDIVIFSPQSQQVIFQLRWINERSGLYLSQNGRREALPNTAEYAEFGQQTDPYSTGPGYPGLRFNAKMYLGEFNNNTSPDILVWHKAYQSNLVLDTPGFSKQSDHFIHYELITTEVNGQQPTGEYLPQTTDQTTIQQWLTANNHTWQSGYPNQTECEGQTGHIPELIDPLLNDPEVLE